MCTLAVSLQSWPGFPVVVAANRDEALDRASTGPQIWAREPRVLAPRDEVAGGTWLGLNARGLFAGITNRYRAPRDPKRRSRGELVLRALEHASADEAHRALAGLQPRDFNAFHLLYADRVRGFVTWSDGERLTQTELGPGLHIVTERSYGAADTQRADDLREAWPSKPTDLLADLRPLLIRHRWVSPFRATCVHARMFNYGTRSSLILGLADALEQGVFLWAEGAPCTHPHLDQSALITELTKG